MSRGDSHNPAQRHVNLATIEGGSSPTTKNTIPAVLRLGEYIDAVVARTGRQHERPQAALSLVFHVSGPLYRPSFSGVRLGSWMKKVRAIGVNISVPESLSAEEAVELVCDAALQALIVGENYLARSQQEFGLDRARSDVEVAVELMRADAPVPKTARVPAIQTRSRRGDEGLSRPILDIEERPFRATGPGGEVWDEPSEDLIRLLIEDCENDGDVVVVDLDDTHFAQTAYAKGKPWVVEYRDGSPDEHYQAWTDDEGVVGDVLSEFAFGLRGWREHLVWERLDFGSDSD